MVKTRYNERSWAIDLISEINTYIKSKDISIKRAGGERTLTSPTTKLFPDLLLFGDEYSGIILQGWELKFPDTSIEDEELLKNASKKADLLGLNSFIVWNVSIAVLYIKNTDNKFSPIKTWNDLIHIDSRDIVESSKVQWISMLKKILSDLNDFLIKGVIRSRTILESFSEEGIIDLILRNSPRIADSLLKNSTINAKFDAEVDKWWRTIKNEYPYEDKPWLILSKIILVTWINKILFAHVIKTYYKTALKIDDLREDSSIKDAINVFKNISKKCDFLNIFREQLGEQFLNKQSWNEIIQLNQLLSDFRLERINQGLLHKLLQKTIHLNRRKAAGQFVTPYALSELLVRLTVEDKNKIVLDPCCGTGTIVKALYNIKKEYGINDDEAIKTIWASDKYSYPVQMTTLSLAFPENIRRIIQVFQSDIVDLKTEKEIFFIDPNNGSDLKKIIPNFNYILSNLPFVQFEDIDIVNPKIKKINQIIGDITNSDTTIPTKADLFAYIPFYLWFLLCDNGKLGIIISNAWLGTDYGEIFRKLLLSFFEIEKVVISGNGRWFKETHVVTNLLILKKRKINKNKYTKSNKFEKNLNEETSFLVIKKSLDEIENQTKSVTSDIITNNKESKFVSIQKYGSKRIELFESYGLEWSSFFTNLSWFSKITNNLIKANSIFEIKRGERRGWDKLFFPPKNNKIEKEYIKPVLKSPTSVDSLIAVPEAKSFCCSKSIKELELLGHSEALSWINRFKNMVNTNGKPLTEILSQPGKYWYEMKNKTLADLVALINYDRRLFFSKLRERSFVNQRFIRFTLIDKKCFDIDLLHALLNSIIGLFYLEALGFGRGLGALDLNATKVRNQLFMLNPNILSNNQRIELKKRFIPLKERKIFPILQEINKKDRIYFDDFVLESYGIINIKKQIIQSLLELYKIRKAVEL